ncbi:inorganic phosphate transporter [Nocardioides sp. Root1257]|uniref:inorganic phosphate transporter n=1 Tax=unclassified Nocardioides TaxID=2615069 RepID=UPI0006F2BF52|nr:MULTISPECIES: inorganic phosphate transporter [unclassified Nocardioides]KQW43004.1 inorganic phosphate transporter [Nocardioides sp. Root1257]KRC41872.1 inorganic phosphate transporter [Nocardioides sp. Root224]
MTAATLILVLVIVTALAFDFTNGFHDTANAMATSIATGALRPKVAVALSAVLNLVGAFLSVEVALTVTNSVIKIQGKDGAPNPDLVADQGYALLLIILGGLVGGIVWNLVTWLLGLPSSSSHALFGGLIGSAVAALGFSGINWNGDGSKLDGVVGKVILPAIASPLIAGLVAGIGTWLVYRVTVGVAERFTETGFRWGQVGSASLVSLAHGTNDAQKTMGVITLALIASGHWSDTGSVPFWVKLSCALAISLGTYLGGWRIIRTLGKGLVEIRSPQGMAAESASAAVILASSHLGFALSTTQVTTGSVVGSGVGKSGAEVRWGVAGRMVVAWLLTLPAAAVMGAAVWWVGDLLGGYAGPIAMVVILVALAAFIYLRSRLQPISADNVNDAWDGTPSAARRTTEVSA